jgi:hypothetical protein
MVFFLFLQRDSGKHGDMTTSMEVNAR